MSPEETTNCSKLTSNLAQLAMQLAVQELAVWRTRECWCSHREYRSFRTRMGLAS